MTKTRCRTMRGLAAGSERDVPLVAGESGAAGVALRC